MVEAASGVGNGGGRGSGTGWKALSEGVGIGVGKGGGTVRGEEGGVAGSGGSVPNRKERHRKIRKV